MNGRARRRLLLALSVAALAAATIVAATSGVPNRPKSDAPTGKNGSALATVAATSGVRTHAADALRMPQLSAPLLGVSLGFLAFAGFVLVIGTTSKRAATRGLLHERGPPSLLLV